MRWLLEKVKPISKCVILFTLTYTVVLLTPMVPRYENSQMLNITDDPEMVYSDTVNLISNQTKPIFVVKTFYYRQSKSFNGSDAIVTVFNGERASYGDYSVQCRRKLVSSKVETTQGIITDLDVSPPMCKLAVFRLACLFPPSGAEVEDFYVGVGKDAINHTYAKLTVSEPNKKPLKFVSCMSRMVAVDDWAMLIFAMETFRYFGGDLAVAPVECAIKEVMKLLKLYENDGILKVQTAFRPGYINGLSYDPNKETEYANQIATSHECFYEYKESAEFISFPDWDDILIGRQHKGQFLSYYDSFAPFLETHPDTAAFSVARMNTNLLTAIHQNQKFSLAGILNNAQFDPTVIDPKIVIRPRLTAGTWIHASKVKEHPKYGELKLNSTTAWLSHLHYVIQSKNESITKPTIKGSDFVNPDELDKNFKKMLKRHSFKFNSTKYPHIRKYHGLIEGCYAKILKDIKENGITYCPTTTSCKYLPQNITVVKATFEYSKPMITENFVWFERSSVEFVTSDKGCL